MELSSDFANSLKLLVPSGGKVNLILVGCGGTGSWLAPSIARYARLISDRGQETSVCFIDPDRVSEKNIYRQNFCPAEIGLYKAETLAHRFGGAWGVEIRTITKAFEPGGSYVDGYGNQVTVVCGCVDNAKARKDVYSHIKSAFKWNWWLDSGNSQSSGQILLGRGDRDRMEEPLALTGFASWLPSPARQHPELVESPHTPLPEGGKSEEGLSCADMAMRDSQGLAINQRMAAEAADYLVRMLITKDLRKMATYIDLESGSSRSTYITKLEVESWLKQIDNE